MPRVHGAHSNSRKRWSLASVCHSSSIAIAFGSSGSVCICCIIMTVVDTRTVFVVTGISPDVSYPPSVPISPASAHRLLSSYLSSQFFIPGLSRSLRFRHPIFSYLSTRSGLPSLRYVRHPGFRIRCLIWRLSRPVRYTFH